MSFWESKITIHKTIQFNIYKWLENKIQYFLLGTYVPLTKDGQIVVDDVLASCYADSHHDIAHFMMTPMQWFPEGIDWLFGQDTGFAFFVGMARELGIFMLPDGQLLS